MGGEVFFPPGVSALGAGTDSGVEFVESWFGSPRGGLTMGRSAGEKLDV